MTLEVQESPELEWEAQSMDDGELWFRTTITGLSDDSLVPNGSMVVVTAEGKNLLTRKGLTVKKLLVYMRASSEHVQEPHVRRYIAAGGNGTVYELGNTGLAMKEAGARHSVHSAMERMDSLYQLLEHAIVTEHLPGWIGLPKHYGYLVPPIDAHNTRQYVLMEQIDGGVTVEDVLSILERGDAERNLIEKRLGHPITDEDIADIGAQWQELQPLVQTAVNYENSLLPKDSRRSFKERVPDFHEGNVLIEKLEKPIAGKRFKLWLIDQ